MSVEADYEASGLVCYPFPLNDGLLVYLWLPNRVLTDDESARLQEFLHSLVAEEPK